MLVISDIHSNYTALKTVLNSTKPIDQVLLAGDSIGFGPHPNKCVETIKKLNANTVKGNHDHAIIVNDYTRFPVDVAKADSLNRTIIKKSNLKWVKEQPEKQELILEGLKVTMFHANPVTPLRGYIQKEDAVQRCEEFKKLTGADLLILGHTHRPYIHRTNDFVIINPGSVGLPRDESRSSYMILDINDGEFEVTNVRMAYDYNANADAMSVLGFPDQYVERMRTGPNPTS